MGAALAALAAGAAEAEAAVAAAEERAAAVGVQDPAQQLQASGETMACSEALGAQGQEAQEAWEAQGPEAEGQGAEGREAQEAQSLEALEQAAEGQQQPGSVDLTAAALGDYQQPLAGVGLAMSDVEGVEVSGCGAPAAILGEFAAVADSSSPPQSVEMLPSPEPPEHSGGDGCSARRGGDGGECGEGLGAGVASAIACNVGEFDGAGHEGMGLEGDAAVGVTPVAAEWSSGSEGGGHREAAGEDSPSLG